MPPFNGTEFISFPRNSMNKCLCRTKIPETMATKLHTYQMSCHDEEKELSTLLPGTSCRHFWRTQKQIHHRWVAWSEWYCRSSEELPTRFWMGASTRHERHLIPTRNWVVQRMLQRLRHLRGHWYLQFLYFCPQAVKSPLSPCWAIHKVTNCEKCICFNSCFSSSSGTSSFRTSSSSSGFVISLKLFFAANGW